MVPSKDIIRHSGNIILISQRLGKRKHECRLPGSNGSSPTPHLSAYILLLFPRYSISGNSPSNTNGKPAVFPIPALDQRHLALGVRAWTLEDLVRVAVAVCCIVGMAEAVFVGVGVRHYQIETESRMDGWK